MASELEIQTITTSPAGNNDDPISEDETVTVTVPVKNKGGTNSGITHFAVYFDFIDKWGYTTLKEYFPLFTSRSEIWQRYDTVIGGNATHNFTFEIDVKKSNRSLFIYVIEVGADNTSDFTTYTVEIDVFKDIYGVTNRIHKRGSCFFGSSSSLGSRNDILNIEGTDNRENDVGTTFTMPYILNQVNYKRIEPDYYRMHYDSSTYTYGGNTPDRSTPSLEIIDMANINSKQSYSPAKGKANIALSYYRNPNDDRTVSSTVHELVDLVGTGLTTTSGDIEVYTEALGLVRGENRTVNEILMDVSELVNAEYWVSTSIAFGSTEPNFMFQSIVYSTTSSQIFNMDVGASTTDEVRVVDGMFDLRTSIESGDTFFNIIELYGGKDETGTPLNTRIMDKSSVDTNGEYPYVLTDDNINSYPELIDKANDLLSLYSRPLTKGTITVEGDYCHLHSKQITFTNTDAGFSEDTFMVRETNYKYGTNRTILSVNSQNIDPASEILDSFSYNIKNNERFQSPTTNEEVKFISVTTTQTSAITNNNQMYMALMTSTSAELSGDGYERKPVVTKNVDKTNFDYTHMRGVWQTWDGKTTDTAPITHIGLYTTLTGTTTELSSPYAIDTEEQYKWKSTQLIVSLTISTT